MPNTGQKSPNCHLCRQRRVKCDLTQPACLRCIKYGVECPGYRKEGDFTFKTQIGTYASRAQKPSRLARDIAKGSPSTVLEGRSPSPNSSVETMIDSCSSDSSLHLQSLPLPTSSAAFVLRRFSVSIRGCDHHREIGRLNDKETLVRSAKLLAAANSATRHRESMGSNATVLSIFLLAIHELLVGTPERESVPAPDAWHTHVKGLSSIIKLRGPNQFSEKHGRALFSMSFSLILTRSLILDIECTPEAPQWLQLFKIHSGDNLVFQSSYVVFSAHNSLASDIAYLSVSVILDDHLRRSHSVVSAMADAIIKDAAGILGDEKPVHLHIQTEADMRSHEIDSTACWMDALRLLWPLTHISRTSIVSPGQRLQARKLLAIIGGNLGIFEARKYSGMARASFCVF
ncbi:hypothetical protein NPX13_g580 [Xylaria arbuscula]|uniref:Zn(2)-C6 fungal-type domain-containing protein n=1 Tax=Xylaria arbuscula TaxID=114810 RepID=A0A9W8NP78_9PEZI|nr:hypothetical protein NPX13_g580 [Xylaria arbuscula]